MANVDNVVTLLAPQAVFVLLSPKNSLVKITAHRAHRLKTFYESLLTVCIEVETTHRGCPTPIPYRWSIIAPPADSSPVSGIERSEVVRRRHSLTASRGWTGGSWLKVRQHWQIQRVIPEAVLHIQNKIQLHFLFKFNLILLFFPGALKCVSQYFSKHKYFVV